MGVPSQIRLCSECGTGKVDILPLIETAFHTGGLCEIRVAFHTCARPFPSKNVGVGIVNRRLVPLSPPDQTDSLTRDDVRDVTRAIEGLSRRLEHC
jgi:hypothetical protein